MISICNLKSVKQATNYYERDDYYTKKECPSQWCGKGAEKLGLSGSVEREDFKDLLSGKLPDGTELPRADGKRRIGIDMSFSPPKSVSLVALIGQDDRVVKAHKEAVTTALNWLEETSIQARKTENGRTKTEETGNMVVARFEHDTSRELDPLIHTHAVFQNVTERQDGEWRAIENGKLYDNRKAADAIYKADLAYKLRRIGYEIEITHSDGRFEIAGIDRDHIKHFSRRREQIVASLERRGLSSPAGCVMKSRIPPHILAAPFLCVNDVTRK